MNPNSSSLANQQLNDPTAVFIFKGVSSQNGNNFQNFVLFPPEYNAISSDIIGMKLDEEKSILRTYLRNGITSILEFATT